MTRMSRAMGDEARRLTARARLALRAERAFGLNAVAITGVAVGVELPREAHPPDGPQPVAAGGDVTQATRSQVVSLFVEPPLQSPTAVAPPNPSEELPNDQKVIRLMQLDEGEVRGCRRCRLCEQRTHTVFGEG